MLRTSAVLGVIVLLLRRGIPESPRWLLNKGRVDQAQTVIKTVYGREIDLRAYRAAESRPTPSSSTAILRGGYLKRTIMCGTLYLAQVTRQAALLNFLPVVSLVTVILGSSIQEVGKQLFHDLGLVDGDDVISVVNDLDARVGQLLAESGCHLGPSWTDSFRPIITRTGIWAASSGPRPQRVGRMAPRNANLKPIMPTTHCCMISCRGS
jgi:hypothetical protein